MATTILGGLDGSTQGARNHSLRPLATHTELAGNELGAHPTARGELAVEVPARRGFVLGRAVAHDVEFQLAGPFATGRAAAAAPGSWRLSLAGSGAVGSDALRRQPGRAAFDAVLGEDQRLDLVEHRRVLLEVGARVLAALADALALEREPGAALLDDADLGRRDRARRRRG